MAVNNSLQKQNGGRMGFVAYLTQDAAKKRINEVLGGENGTRFISSIISAVNANPDLQECTNSSILSGALLGESLKLSPSPMLGHYYLVPFNDREQGKVATFQIGYKGMLQLAIRSGYYKRLNVVSIKAGELIKFDPLTEEIEVRLIEDDEAREAAETIGYYAMFEYTNGFRKAIYWSKKKMEAHALKYSQGYMAKKGFTFWEKDFDGMAYKTMLRQLISKWGIMSIDMQNAIESDMATIKADGTPEYVDNKPDFMPAPEAPDAIEEKPVENVEKPARKKAIKTEPENMNVNAVQPVPADTQDAAAALFG